MARINVTLPQDLYDWASREAELDHRTLSSFCVSVLARYREAMQRKAQVSTDMVPSVFDSVLPKV